MMETEKTIRRLSKILNGLAFFIALAPLSGQADVNIVYRSSTLEAAVVAGSWKDIGSSVAETSNLDTNGLFPMTVRASLDHAFSNAIHSKWLAKKLSSRILASFQPTLHQGERDLISGISEILEVSEDVMQKAFFVPEAQNWIVLKLKSLTNFFAACSAFVGQDLEGRILFGRNMDFQSAGVLDRSLGVYLIKPTGKARMLVVSPRGFILPGLSGMNEFGLTLTLHTAVNHHISSKKGDPVLSVNREILEQAKSVKEALEIYKNYHYMSGWLVQIADAEGEAGVVELSGAGVRFVPKNEFGVTALSNSYQSRQGQLTEVELAPGMRAHNRDRLERLQELVKSEIRTSRGNGSLLAATRILADSFSPYSGTSAVFTPSGIRTVEQVMSMIFLPKERAVWVADNSPTPTSLAHYYAKFSFDSMDDAARENRWIMPPSFEVSNDLILPGADYSKRRAAEKALTAFVAANAEATQKGNFRKAYDYLKRAVAISPDCSFNLFLGSYALHFALKDQKTGDRELAELNLKDARSCSILSPHQQAIAAYLQGILGLLKNDFTQASLSLNEGLMIESDLPKSMSMNPDPSLMRVIRYYQDIALRRRPGIGRWAWGNPHVLIEMKPGDRVLGWL